jgi:hypothetical protein
MHASDLGRGILIVNPRLSSRPVCPLLMAAAGCFRQ